MNERALRLEMTRLITLTLAWSVGVGITVGIAFAGLAAVLAW